MSLPAWGEWIEIGFQIKELPFKKCLSPHGESGLKLVFKLKNYLLKNVSPRMGRVD